ncbi:MAG: LolA family protein [Phocaeicola sp.]
MKKTYYTLLFLLFSLSVWGQKEVRARELLDHTWALFQEGKGISLTFTGTIEGTMQLKGKMFHLQSQGIESWFDGDTQWSYLANSDEVNITTPTPEDLQQTHPFYLLSSYKNGYNYRFVGEKMVGGKPAYEVILTPEKRGEIVSVTLIVSKNYEPLYFKIKSNNQTDSEIKISSFQTGQSFNDANFKFDKKRYSSAEIIDLR